ncbi:MAG TPA: helix-turn-helix domain-containing protein [Sphingomonadaceae bacterium]|nr:helix-turn-helix domain-containing protein [Sphingomonadaceae bacterium]
MWSDGLPQLEALPADAISPDVDLRRVEEEQRYLMWTQAARKSFPGLTVRFEGDTPASGMIRRIPISSGDLFEIESAPVEVNFRPTPATDGGFISVMVQAEGSTMIQQGKQRSSLAKGDICLLDEACTFKIVGEDWSRICFLRLPRTQVLARHPQLERYFALAMPASDAGTRLLADLLLRLFWEAPLLCDAQHRAMLGSMIHMLGVASPSAGDGADKDWRTRRAIDFIEQNLALPGLSAEDIARDQHISRRRLDQIMHEQLGQSIAACLWTRRLAQAARDLRDPQRADESIAQIAFANGFGDAAHFTRAFKRRYSATPGQWRHI